MDRPTDPPAALCIRAGYLALRRVADFFTVLLALADLTMAPEAPWTGDRSRFVAVLPLLHSKKKTR
ncbi:MAG: hypothetical protein P8074_10510 [Anaerolineales bacterium]